MLSNCGNFGAEFAIQGRGQQPDQPVGGGSDLVLTGLPFRDLGFVGVKITAESLSVQPEMLSKETELLARQPRGTVRQRPRDGAMNLCHPWNDRVRVAALWTIRDLNAS